MKNEERGEKQRMDFDKEDIELIKKMFFVQNRFLKQVNGKWKTINRPIQPREIISHFKHRYSIGYFLKKSNFMVFDVDFHGEKSKQNRDNFRYRRDKIINTFGTPRLIFRTPSGGLHLYYALNDFYTISEIRSKVSELIKPSPGKIELFPGNRGLRLFGGTGCVMLKPDFSEFSNDPEVILKESINALKLKGFFVDPIWAETFEQPLNLNDITKKIVHVNRVASPKLKEEMENLFKNGLKAEGTRNESLLRLNWYFQTYGIKIEEETKKLTPEEAERELIKWISKKNNGKSKDWKRNPKAVIKQIGYIARGYDPSKINWAKRFPVELLSSKNLEAIERVSKRISKKYPEINRFKLEAFLQDLMSYCKIKHHNFEVPIPRGVFQKCRYGSRGRYVKFLEKLSETHVLTQKVSYSADAHKCRVFSVSGNLINENSHHINCGDSHHIINIMHLRKKTKKKG